MVKARVLVGVSDDTTILRVRDKILAKIEGANSSTPVARCATRGQQVGLVIGRTLNSAEEIGNLELTARDGRTVYVRDVADVALPSAAVRMP